MSREETQTTDRSRMPVTMDGVDYPSARQALMALGLNQTQRREPRKELRRIGKVEIMLAGRTHVIKRCDPAAGASSIAARAVEVARSQARLELQKC